MDAVPLVIKERKSAGTDKGHALAFRNNLLRTYVLRIENTGKIGLSVYVSTVDPATVSPNRFETENDFLLGKVQPGSGLFISDHREFLCVVRTPDPAASAEGLARVSFEWAPAAKE